MVAVPRMHDRKVQGVPWSFPRYTYSLAITGVMASGDLCGSQSFAPEPCTAFTSKARKGELFPESRAALTSGQTLLALLAYQLPYPPPAQSQSDRQDEINGNLRLKIPSLVVKRNKHRKEVWGGSLEEKNKK